MSRHGRRPFGSPVGKGRRFMPGGRVFFDAGAAAHFDTSPEEEKRKPPKVEQGRHGYTTFSAACKKNQHGSCAALKCECDCHGGPI